jgi:membrane protein implicated in regulation of membrane protease activity
VKRHLRARFWAKDGDPGPLAWAIALVSLALPISGVGLCLAGGRQLLRGDADGWGLLGIGIGALCLDMLIDFGWAHPGVSESDQPDLNRRGAQLAGRHAIILEAIEGGRGKVRVGDTVWPAEGPDMPAGSSVRIVSASTTVLLVEASPEGDA